MTEPRAIQTPHAPAAIGPYSQAIVHGGLVYCSGQVGLVPATGQLVSDDVELQARQCLANLRAVLEAAGSSFALALRCTIYLTDLSHFQAVNGIYAEAFAGATPPARATVEVSRLPKDARVEIDCIAALRG